MAGRSVLVLYAYDSPSKLVEGQEGGGFPKPRVTGSEPQGFEYPAQSGVHLSFELAARSLLRYSMWSPIRRGRGSGD